MTSFYNGPLRQSTREAINAYLSEKRFPNPEIEAGSGPHHFKVALNPDYGETLTGPSGDAYTFSDFQTMELTQEVFTTREGEAPLTTFTIKLTNPTQSSDNPDSLEITAVDANHNGVYFEAEDGLVLINITEEGQKVPIDLPNGLTQGLGILLSEALAESQERTLEPFKPNPFEHLN